MCGADPYLAAITPPYDDLYVTIFSPVMKNSLQEGDMWRILFRGSFRAPYRNSQEMCREDGVLRLVRKQGSPSTDR